MNTTDTAAARDQQGDERRLDLTGAPAVEKIRAVVSKNKTCFFVTTHTSPFTDAQDAGYDSESARPMSVLEVDDAGQLWFMSASDSRKNFDLAQDPRVTLYLQGSEHSGFMRLIGRASIHTDRVTIDRLWSPLLKAWFTDGIDDPRISCLRFQIDSGFYWDNRNGDTVAGIKMAIGALLGKTLDDSQVGQIKP